VRPCVHISVRTYLVYVCVQYVIHACSTCNDVSACVHVLLCRVCKPTDHPSLSYNDQQPCNNLAKNDDKAALLTQQTPIEYSHQFEKDFRDNMTKKHLAYKTSST
jgi:hypothetical protein